MLFNLKNISILFFNLTFITGVVYPLIVTGIGKVFFPKQANGSLLFQQGKLVGSELLGQSFTDEKYFWGRPSATAHFSYNTMASGGSNLSQMNNSFLEVVKTRIAALKAAHPGQNKEIPLELLMASASGLDPHISPEAAEYQVARIAQVRKMSPKELFLLIHKNTQESILGVLGEPRVNVLKLNMDLDNLSND